VLRSFELSGVSDLCAFREQEKYTYVLGERFWFLERVEKKEEKWIHTAKL
jgi:hypothetical protein